jgi:hypothetical protein
MTPLLLHEEVDQVSDVSGRDVERGIGIEQLAFETNVILDAATDGLPWLFWTSPTRALIRRYHQDTAYMWLTEAMSTSA